MPRYVRNCFALLIVAMIFGVPVAYAAYRKAQVRNFRCVRDGVLFRSGQLTPSGLKQVEYDHGIKTVITFRDAHVAGDPPPDRAEEEYCHRRGVRYYRIPPRNWSAPDGSVPAEQSVQRFLQIMDDPSHYPVLIHCFRGVHRSGAYSAIYRMEYERWSKEAALAEMQLLGYTTLDDEKDILTYLENYRPRWKGKE